MSLRPLHDRVVVNVDPPNRFTESGLEIIQAWNPQTWGTVVSCGSGVLCDVCGATRPMAVKPGDFVVFPYSVGQDVTVDGESRLMLRETDILAVVEYTDDGADPDA